MIKVESDSSSRDMLFSSVSDSAPSLHREEPDLPAGVPEHDALVLVEFPPADVGDEAGHGFGGIRRVEKDRLGARGELHGLARLAAGDAGAGARGATLEPD